MTNKSNFLLHFLCVYSIISIYHFINTVFIVSVHLHIDIVRPKGRTHGVETGRKGKYYER